MFDLSLAREVGRALALLLVVATPVRAIDIQIDYSLDAGGFFNQAGAQEAMEAVAVFFEEKLTDSLLAIDQNAFGGSVSWSAVTAHPATGGSTSFPAFVVPADTIIVFVGSRDLPAGNAGVASSGGFSAGGSSLVFDDWLALLNGRGHAGAAFTNAALRTDFSPWGGSIAFDSVPDRPWHFQLEGRPSGSNTGFVSTALHEMGHILGVGLSDSWKNQIVGGVFTGPVSREAFGNVNPPVQVPNGGHWQDDAACVAPAGWDPANPLNVLSLAYGSFGQVHGHMQIAAMDPSSCVVSSYPHQQVFTDLDFAALADIGWEVQLPVQLEPTALGPSGAAFRWPSSTGVDYVMQRSTTDPNGFVNVSSPFTGSGLLQSWIDPAPPSERAMYRVSTGGVLAGSAASAAVASSVRLVQRETFVTHEVPVQTVSGCDIGHSHE